MSLATLVAAVIVIAMIVYVASGGADFGGGIWDLLATGPRADKQRELLWKAIAPIWEANHVWLIVALVLMFVGFPKAFSAILTALHIPVTIMLVGIVLRGSAFAFRSYSAGDTNIERRSATIFAVSSVATPVMLGVVAGAIATGDITIGAEGMVQTDFVSAWLAPFPFAIGLFTLALCAFLSAVYMTVEVKDDEELREDFRTRALWSAVAVGATALLSLILSREGAPLIWKGLLATGWALPFHIATGLAAIGTIWAVWTRRFRPARLLAIAQTAMIIAGWGLAQYPYIVPPDLTVAATAAPDSVLWPVTLALAAGAVLLVPSFWYLYRVFKD
jgi:cytochrome d ubiquinol oxidase subunit II